MAAGATYTPIGTVTMASATASYTFTSIPQTYTDLICVVSSRSDDASYQNAVKLYNINSDTASNYSYTGIFGDGTSASSNRQSNAAFILFGGYTTTLTSGVYEIHTINIQNYTNTSTYKSVVGRRSSAGTTGYVAAAGGLWRSTSAITSLSIAQQIGNLVAGSTITLYGISAA